MTSSKPSHLVPFIYETFRHACEKLTTDVYKTEKSGEKNYVNLSVKKKKKKIVKNIYHADKEHTDVVVTYTDVVTTS